MKKRLQAVLGTMLAVSLAGRAFALGTASYSVELISPRSLGQGGTGVSGAQNDPIATYTNPAGLAEMKGTQVTAGLSYANASPKFTNDQGQVSGARASSVVIPDFAATTQFLDGRLAAGLALVAPYGLETHWDGDSPVRYSATDARLRIIDVTPSVAYKVCPGFSVGAGVDYYNTVEAQLDSKIHTAALNFSLGGPFSGADAGSRLNGNGDGWGYHLGATFKPNERHQIGLVYHSAVKMNLTGDVEFTGLSGVSAAVFGGSNVSFGASAPVYIPQNLQLGYAYMPNERWNLEVDAAWYDWYDARQLGIVYSGLTPTQSSILNGSGNPQIFNPRKTLNFGLGADYKSSDALHLRGGAYYQAAALPESAFDPAFVDLPRYALTAGAGYQLAKDLGLDVAYNAIFFHTRHVKNPDPLNGYSGYFSSFANILSASLTYRTDWHL